jgi:hypothetical protein
MMEDAKQACEKLHGFSFQSRYLSGISPLPSLDPNPSSCLK